MSGRYGPATIWRALKADFLSLTSFQVGLYGWMAIYQIAIWNFHLEMTNVVYWWMMQVGIVGSLPRSSSNRLTLYAGWDVFGSLDGCSDELASHKAKRQRAVRMSILSSPGPDSIHPWQALACIVLINPTGIIVG